MSNYAFVAHCHKLSTCQRKRNCFIVHRDPIAIDH